MPNQRSPSAVHRGSSNATIRQLVVDRAAKTTPAWLRYRGPEYPAADAFEAVRLARNELDAMAEQRYELHRAIGALAGVLLPEHAISAIVIEDFFALQLRSDDRRQLLTRASELMLLCQPAEQRG